MTRLARLKKLLADLQVMDQELANIPTMWFIQAFLEADRRTLYLQGEMAHEFINDLTHAILAFEAKERGWTFAEKV